MELQKTLKWWRKLCVPNCRKDKEGLRTFWGFVQENEYIFSFFYDNSVEYGCFDLDTTLYDDVKSKTEDMDFTRYGNFTPDDDLNYHPQQTKWPNMSPASGNFVLSFYHRLCIKNGYHILLWFVEKTVGLLMCTRDTGVNVKFMHVMDDRCFKGILYS